MATYNWDVGTIQRANDDEKKYEVASHQWFDLTDKSGAYGVTVLSDSKNGSDKPNDNTLRLTLIRTPGIGTGNGRDYADQTTQDWGHHDIVFGLAGHAGDWRQGQTDWQAWRLNQPLIAFTSSKHDGTLGRNFSLLRVSSGRARVLALKKAELGDEYIVRLVELDGKPQANVHIAFAAPIAAAREVNGAEEPVGAATLTDGELVTSFTANQPRTFAVKLAPATAQVAAVQSAPVALPYDRSVANPDGRPALGGFDSQGRALPGELLPREVEFGGVRFALAPATEGKPNAVTAQGQTIDLPAGQFNRLYLLAAAADGDQVATFSVGPAAMPLQVQDWGGFIGQWDTRLWRQVEQPPPPEPAASDMSPAAQRARRIRDRIRREGPIMRPEYAGLAAGFIKLAPLGWYASHRHAPDGANDPYAYSYLFVYELPVPGGAKTVTLPNNERIRILAMSVASVAPDAWPATPLLDFPARTAPAGFYGPQSAATK